MNLQSFRINTRLLAGFATVLILMGAGSLVGLWQLKSLEAVIERLATEEVAKVTLSELWMSTIAANVVRLEVALVLDPSALIEEMLSSSEVAREKRLGHG